MAAVIDMAFLTFGDERILASGASDDSAVREYVVLGPVYPFAFQYILHLLEKGHGNQRFVAAFECFAAFKDAHEADVEGIPQNRSESVDSYLSSGAVVQATANHLICQTGQGIFFRAVQFKRSLHERRSHRILDLGFGRTLIEITDGSTERIESLFEPTVQAF